MTMPRKGRRSIVVENKTYHYMIKVNSYDWYSDYKEASVTIEAPDGRIYSDKTRHESIIPSYVEKLIREHLLK